MKSYPHNPFLNEQDSQLVQLTLDLDMPHFWEINVSRAFPETDFIIQSSYPSHNDSCSGLLKIKNGSIPEIKKYLSKQTLKTNLEAFHEYSGLFYFSVKISPPNSAKFSLSQPKFDYPRHQKLCTKI